MKTANQLSQTSNFSMDIQSILEEAKNEPVKEDRFNALMPVITILREEKEFTWGEIQAWLSVKTGFSKSPAFWIARWKVYKKESTMEATAPSSTDIDLET